MQISWKIVQTVLSRRSIAQHCRATDAAVIAHVIHYLNFVANESRFYGASYYWLLRLVTARPSLSYSLCFYRKIVLSTDVTTIIRSPSLSTRV